MKKKILILYTAHTLGHKTIAENIGYYLSELGHTVTLVDALETEKTSSVSSYLKLHVFVYRYLPFIWRWMYLWGYVLVMPFLKFLARFHSKKILGIIKDFEPDVIISTQISPSGIVSYLKSKGLYTGLFGIAFSDFHFHPAWLYPNANFYLANIPEQKEHILGMGVSSEKVFVCGITIKPKQSVDRSEVRRKLGIPEDAKIILVSSGSLGVRLPTNIVDMLKSEVHLAMREQGKHVHTIIVCGKNKELYQNLKQEVTDANFHIFGFYEPMSELYAIADIYITKPGGLSVIESLQWNLPLFVTHILPGQGELNLQYLANVKLTTPLYVKPTCLWAGEIIEELISGKIQNSLTHNNHALRLLRDSNGEAIKRSIVKMFDEA